MIDKLKSLFYPEPKQTPRAHPTSQHLRTHHESFTIIHELDDPTFNLLILSKILEDKKKIDFGR